MLLFVVNINYKNIAVPKYLQLWSNIYMSNDVRFEKIRSPDKSKLLLLHEIIDEIEPADTFERLSDADKKYLFNPKYRINFGAYKDRSLISALGLEFDKQKLSHYSKVLAAKGLASADTNICSLEHLMTHPDHRSSPYADGLRLVTILSEIAVNQARKREYEFIVATTHPENKPSRRVFEKLDFEIATEDMKSRSGYPRLLLTKEL